MLIRVDGGGRGRGRGEKTRNLHSPTPTPLLIFDRRPPPWYKFIPLPSLPLPLKSKIAAIIFNMNLLSTRSPKLRFLCRLKQQKIHICVLKSFPPNSVASIVLFAIEFSSITLITSLETLTKRKAGTFKCSFLARGPE